MIRPSANGDNGGRDAGGRFADGNSGGPGNPYAQRVARLRALLLDAVTDDDLQAVVKKLVAEAKAGDMPAARLLLGYAVGRPLAADPDEAADATGATGAELARLEAARERTEAARAQLAGMYGDLLDNHFKPKEIAGG